MKDLCFCGGWTNVFCRELVRISSACQSYVSVPVRNEHDVEIFGSFLRYDFRDTDNCLFNDRLLDGLNSLDLITQRCGNCGTIEIFGFPTQLKWQEDASGDGAFCSQNCGCGELLILHFPYRTERQPGEPTHEVQPVPD